MAKQTTKTEAPLSPSHPAYGLSEEERQEAFLRALGNLLLLVQEKPMARGGRRP